jgi:hypothetical protein
MGPEALERKGLEKARATDTQHHTLAMVTRQTPDTDINQSYRPTVRQFPVITEPSEGHNITAKGEEGQPNDDTCIHTGPVVRESEPIPDSPANYSTPTAYAYPKPH